MLNININRGHIVDLGCDVILFNFRPIQLDTIVGKES